MIKEEDRLNHLLETNDFINDQFTSIKLMLDKASNAGMLVGVVWSFADEIHSGSSIDDAVKFALKEWDL
jgi:hypothetical protein